MLWAPRPRVETVADNLGSTPSASPGTSVTPGASNAEGSYTQILSALVQEVSGFYLKVSDGATSASAKPHLLDIGIDPAGGSSYNALISNIVCGASAPITATGSGHKFFFPIRIPNGSTVAARIQGANATAGTVRVSIQTYSYGQGTRAPWALPVGQYSETIGTITNSDGVSFTPGTGTAGTWVSLGTTSRDLWWWQLGYQINNGTITAEYTRIDLAVGDSSNKRVILWRTHGGTTGETVGDSDDIQLLSFAGYAPVPAGSEMWIRGACLNAPDSGYNGVAIGIG